MILSGLLMSVGAIGSLVMVLDFLRPIRHTNPFAGCPSLPASSLERPSEWEKQTVICPLVQMAIGLIPLVLLTIAVAVRPTPGSHATSTGNLPK